MGYAYANCAVVFSFPSPQPKTTCEFSIIAREVEMLELEPLLEMVLALNKGSPPTGEHNSNARKKVSAGQEKGEMSVILLY